MIRSKEKLNTGIFLFWTIITHPKKVFTLIGRRWCSYQTRAVKKMLVMKMSSLIKFAQFCNISDNSNDHLWKLSMFDNRLWKPKCQYCPGDHACKSDWKVTQPVFFVHFYYHHSSRCGPNNDNMNCEIINKIISF